LRFRIALDLKGSTCEDTAINLDRGDQFKPEYKAQKRPGLSSKPRIRIR
jgi:hypothetical protein